MNHYIISTSSFSRIKSILLFSILQLTLLICVSDRAGAQVWEYQPKLDFSFDAFIQLNDDTIYTLSGPNFIYSFDGGNSWDSSFTDSAVYGGSSLDRSPDGTLWIWFEDCQLIGQKLLLRSTDNGLSWKPIVKEILDWMPFPQLNTFTCKFRDSLNGFVFDKDSLFVTSNGGINFQFRKEMAHPRKFICRDQYWAVFAEDDLMHTSLDSGQTWTVKSSGSMSYIPYEDPIQILDSSTVYYAEYLQFIKVNFDNKTHDTIFTAFTSQGINDFEVLSPDTILFLSNGIFRSVNGGVGYNEEHADIPIPFMEKIHRFGNSFFLSSSGTVYKFNPSGTFGILEQQPPFRKTSIWPNPTDGIINFDSQADEFKLIDCRGRLILSSAFPVNQISIEHLPAGVYYLRVFTKDGNETISLIKY